MDVQIPEEYIVRRRREKSVREIAAGDRSFRERNEEKGGREAWKLLMRGIEEGKVGISSGGEKGGNDTIFGFVSA